MICTHLRVATVLRVPPADLAGPPCAQRRRPHPDGGARPPSVAPMSDINQRPEGCVFRTLSATASGATLGGIMGAVTTTWSVRSAAPRRGGRSPHRSAGRAATWTLPRTRRVRALSAARAPLLQDVPKVLKGKAWPALVATGRVMGVYGATFAAIGGIFAAVDVRALRPAGSTANPRHEQGLTRDARPARPTVRGGGRSREEGLLERSHGRRCGGQRHRRARCVASERARA